MSDYSGEPLPTAREAGASAPVPPNAAAPRIAALRCTKPFSTKPIEVHYPIDDSIRQLDFHLGRDFSPRIELAFEPSLRFFQ
jgi:hypothetical protein